MLQGTENSLPTPYMQLCPNPWPNDFLKKVKIKTYREETSKKIPHLDDVVCHAVQTETRHGSLLALHPNAEVELQRSRGTIIHSNLSQASDCFMTENHHLWIHSHLKRHQFLELYPVEWPIWVSGTFRVVFAAWSKMCGGGNSLPSHAAVSNSLWTVSEKRWVNEDSTVQNKQRQTAHKCSFTTFFLVWPALHWGLL